MAFGGLREVLVPHFDQWGQLGRTIGEAEERGFGYLPRVHEALEAAVLVVLRLASEGYEEEAGHEAEIGFAVLGGLGLEPLESGPVACGGVEEEERGEVVGLLEGPFGVLEKPEGQGQIPHLLPERDLLGGGGHLQGVFKSAELDGKVESA